MRRTPVPLLLAALLSAVVATAGAPPARAATASATPTVAAELARMEASGAIDGGRAAGYRTAYDDARRTLKRLTGFRRAQLAAVVAHVDGAAAGGRFTPSRLPALFLTLQRNRAWWAASPLPAAGARTTFSGSQIVWQFYPGQGWQIQWLGTFGKANALWADRAHDDDLRRILDEALGLATERAGGIAFEYQFTFDGGRPPWVSGLAQATALSALARAAVRLHDSKYFEAARAALGIFRTPPPAGVRVDTPAGAHYLQYSYAPQLHIVNGFTQALNGLRDFSVLANDAEGRALFAAGEAQLRAELPGFDTGAWSLYARPGAESDLGYHALLRDFLRGLCARLTEDRARDAAATPDPALYCDTAERFTADLTTRPRLAVVVPGTALRAKRAASVAFTLDKVSVVTVTMVRRGAVVLSRTARLGRGRHRVAIRPAKAGALLMRVRAVDLAGNAAAASADIPVRPAPARHPAKKPRHD